MTLVLKNYGSATGYNSGAHLEHSCSIAEDKVHCAYDVISFVKLLPYVDVEGILVAIKCTSKQGRVIGFRVECNSLELLWSGGVNKFVISSNEVVSKNIFTKTQTTKHKIVIECLKWKQKYLTECCCGSCRGFRILQPA